MTFSFYRIFCATPANLEDELSAFHDVVGQVNEQIGMPVGSLLLPLCVPPHVTDTALLRQVLDQNVSQCAFFVQVFSNGWGPPQRNLQRHLELAAKLLKNPAAPMQAMAAFIQQAPETESDQEIAQLKTCLLELQQPTVVYHDLSEFKRSLRARVTEWLRCEAMKKPVIHKSPLSPLR